MYLHVLFQVSHVILTEQRLIHEQETSKAVKEFVMETIQFRNAFDTEGPLVPGLIPTEAVSRVGKTSMYIIHFKL